MSIVAEEHEIIHDDELIVCRDPTGTHLLVPAEKVDEAWQAARLSRTIVNLLRMLGVVAADDGGWEAKDDV